MKKLLSALILSLFLPVLVLAQSDVPTEDDYFSEYGDQGDPAVTDTQNSSKSAIQQMQNNAAAINAVVGFQSATVPDIVSGVLTVVLSLLGIIFLGLIVFSGIQWMTAGGNEEAIKKARNNIKNAVIGLIVVALSYTITYFIFNQDWSSIGNNNSVGGSGTVD
jgi:hypothetical protein